MHDAAGVSGGESLADLDAELHGLAWWQAPVREPLAQGLAFEELGNQVRPAVVRAHVVDGQHVGMVEGRDGMRFLLEASQPLGVLGGVARDHLEADLAPETRVAGSIDFAHPTRPDRGHDLVGAEPSARSEAHEGNTSSSRTDSQGCRRQDLPDLSKRMEGDRGRLILTTSPAPAQAPSVRSRAMGTPIMERPELPGERALACIFSTACCWPSASSSPCPSSSGGAGPRASTSAPSVSAWGAFPSA